MTPGVRTLAIVLAAAFAAPAAAAPTRFSIYTVWMQGQGDGDRAHIDAFMTCLVESSNFADFWGGNALVDYHGSSDIPGPNSAGLDGVASWLSSAIAGGKVPKHEAGTTPVYLVLGDKPSAGGGLNIGACGFNGVRTVDGVKAGLATVAVHPICWHTGDYLRNDTQFSEHEVAEVIDQLFGYSGCCGDGECEANGNCANPCSNFTGLSCAGAPANTASGCGGTSVTGWLVQKLSHGERVGNTCDICTNCDFTVKLGCAGGGKLVNQPCAANADCCAGLTCQLWSYSGQAPYQTNCCKAVGQACTLNTECCGGSNCSGGSCACVAAGQWCLNDADCCAGMVCDMSGSPKCAPPPPPPDLAGAVDLARGPIGDGAARGDAARGGGDGGAASDGGDEGSVMGGCGCRVGGARAASSPWMFALLAALALAAARRKR